VNLNKGYAFQIFGGGEEGVVGKGVTQYDDEKGEYYREYSFDPIYSSTVNLKGTKTIYSSDGTDPDIPESEYLYGGGNEGDVCGNTYVNLGNGRIYDAFGGASNADILGHTEVYIGRQPNGSGGYKDGFPWIRDNVYGGNDFGGTIWGNYEEGYDFTSRIENYADRKAMIHGYNSDTDAVPEVLKSATYVDYYLGRIDTIYGGGYAQYNYADTETYGEDATMPYQSSSFVNIRPKYHEKNALQIVFGGGSGYPKNRDGDKSQDRSYVLVDIPKNGDKDADNFINTEIFGSGSYNGMGMRFNKAETFTDSFDPDRLSAIIDLMRGKIQNVYGGSFNEGITARTVVNVPPTSTISVDRIFGGAYGTQILPPCDVFESNVNYDSNDATVTGAIYGGNNNERRTLYAKVNVSAPIWSDRTKGYLATVYGAGHGIDTWAEYTEVNLNPKPEGVAGDYTGAKVYEVYGGGEMGHVLNAESVQKYMQLYSDKPSPQISTQDPFWKALNDGNVLWESDGTLNSDYAERWAADWKDAWSMGEYYTPNADYTNYVTNGNTNLTNTALVTHDAGIDDRDFTGYAEADKERSFKKYNTNVLIHEGATVVNYAYGGGLGDTGTHLSGDVYGNTYIALLGGTVTKDIYAAGTAGAVNDVFGVGPYNASTNPYGFTATANAYIKGGSCRNVYGGGWKGNVGYHTGAISASTVGDIPGDTHVVIGDVDGTSFTNGIPTVTRNAYGGGEGGAVFGTAHLTMNKGYVGYIYNPDGADNPETTGIDEHYEEKTEDDTKPTPNTLLTDAGCLFGGGYIDNSSVDKTKVNIYGGHVRGSAFGGGEIAAIGRGDMKAGSTTSYELKGIYRPGKTNIEMYGGQVHRNVYGGGRGVDNLGVHGSLNCDGYVFGQTEVHIHGGEIGTISGVEDGNGNVFGGGDEGHVYSAYEKADGTFGIGKKDGVRYDPLYQGYYYKYENGDYVTVNVAGEGETPVYERQFTEDCKVLVEPHLKVNTAVSINGTDYTPGQYVLIADLNKLKDKNTDADKWGCLDDTGIIIHNAVFAGGNMPSGAVTTTANTTTVFGNATASVNDIYHRDMITMGTRHTGGLYGDGNLTLVDGYRELNITNYGTDYYSIAKTIDINTYHALPDREAAYYELNYTCLKECHDKKNNIYNKDATITADDMLDLFLVYNETKGEYESHVYGGKDVLRWNDSKKEWEPNPDAGYWEESGVLPVYAGRLMNSIQRADFCGVFGSRMVMQGARDRVPDEADYTNYTINRVREVSLNKKESTITGDAAPFHGNYFGIYNIVNYLGALTSDVDFGDETNRPYARTTDNTSDDSKYKCIANEQIYTKASFYDWKKQFPTDRRRNNGNSHNKVALASGVYLEITTEESTGPGLYEKVWGPVTGVIELDLINVSTGIGGGFVYAKNEHGVRSKTGHLNTTLTKLNENAVTKWDFTYSTTENAANQMEWETSGNFVHSTQTIIDDCYNVSNRYMGEGKMPAHYWYIKGSVYVYDQYISAYTGSPNAYSETVDIPLTLAAASHGKMKLLNVMPNLYAYYASPGIPLNEDQKMVINEKTYSKNDPISYWDWYLLSKYEKELFVEKTFVNCITCKIDGVEYAAGTKVMTDTEFTTYKTTTHTYTDAENKTIKDANNNPVDDEYIFRSSNNISHDMGYILTYEVNNPSKWDNWYTPKSGDYKDKLTLAEYDVLNPSSTGSGESLVLGKDAYEDGPTYRLITATGGEILGRSSYKVGNLISKAVYDTYQDAKKSLKTASGSDAALSDSAHFEKAYIVKTKFSVIEDESEHYYNPGMAVSKTFADAHSSNCEEAYICTSSIQLSKDDIIYKDTKMSKTEAEGYITTVSSNMDDLYFGAGSMTTEAIKALEPAGVFTAEKKKQLVQLATVKDELKAYLVPAYYCAADGSYGGNYYMANKNYRGLEAWSSMSETDRAKFTFNYDALDLLIDPAYSRDEGQKYQYDGAYTTEEQVKNASTGNKAGYSITQSVDYTATYNGKNDDPTEETEGDNKDKKYMTVPTAIVSGGKVYAGDELTREQYEALPNEQRHYAPVATTTAGTYYVVNTDFQVGSTPYAIGEPISQETYISLPETEQSYVTALTIDEAHENKTYYYCREAHTPSASITTISSSVIPGAGTGAAGSMGTLISADQYGALPNQQKNFTIHGISPTETSTLFVSRESDIYDLSKEKIITVIYKYDYDETDGSGNVTPISERHVLNIHLSFKSGVPTVDKIHKPDIILPGDFTSLRQPIVTPGAYEITGGGWELFQTKRDAESHTNGIEYIPSVNPLYWYQDDWYVAYYAKSYLGRTYSNAVPVSVANYHDLAEVMSDGNKAHHMYIDNRNVKREPKIYINDYSGSGKNGLDLLKNLYDLSLLTNESTGVTDGKVTAEGDLEDHALLNKRVEAADSLEFFLRTDISHPDSWTTIGDDTHCFKGNLHGDGHTISGLNNSLFYNLCGNVYNLGVTGSFSSAGVVDKGTGYVESSWVKTTGTPDGSVRAVFGNPTASENVKQVVNSYYQTGKNYGTDDTYSHGLATAMPEKAFYNGELAYDLNNFYLYKRYCDKAGDGAFGANPVRYNYWLPGNNELQEGRYAKHEDLCSSGFIDSESREVQYVEDRFVDGDFRYAGGSIPGSEDVRHYVDTEDDDKEYWFPIWPDDYMFFGQALNYDHVNGLTHQNVPTAIRRSDGMIDNSESSNRVYRAPAYFRSKTMGVAHFNKNAVFAQSKKNDAATIAYKGMTAIDFTGYDDTHVKANGDEKAYELGLNAGKFYAPLLDEDGLTGFKNIDLTRNLLVYTVAASTTATTVSNYLEEPVYEESTEGYRSVEWKDPQTVHGHWLQQVESKFSTNLNQLLVDLNDFNAPIPYDFTNNTHMWYQRTPEDGEFVDRTKGWQGISIPFTAELVTTSQKGEITHFYDGSETSKNETGSKIGHEYWLRHYRDISGVSGEDAIRTARFTYPTKDDGEVMHKTDVNKVTNTFLWDHYYKGVQGGHNHLDYNKDTYQTYYKNPREYPTYPMLTAATPYLIGLPGMTYYEFDLSGNFSATTTASPNPAKLDKQTITFVSQPNINIGVSDDKIAEATAAATKNGYAFVPSFMSQTIDAGENTYTLKADGSSYDKVPAAPGDATTVQPFRPYFKAVASPTKEYKNETRSIVFSNNGIGDLGSDDELDDDNETGSLEIYSKGRKIYTVSHLEENTDIRIVNASGAVITTYTLKPGKTIVTTITNPGAYIVNKKKLFIK
jgi:hypothetical protein